ncbi:pirin family protein [Rufibacter glacialis]|uniref:Pirin family protein n=1 Tax=Rufibacter glacialis TaxID=1259555 RepID=A0A5M8QAF4_9BACT|nr:pirin-like bicupin family protein [Rufibacter glacialis]KAA6431806.1 pirin family protein [Rufibacter glacialis]GGK81412.1 quercetin 2,3-dioxygenase [Rufibacter glacialis]
MIKVIPASERHHATHGWLDSYFLFSFSDYYDPNNVQWGPLRVFNDDYIKGNSGFPEHSHSEMEIVTIVLEGEVTHSDSLGNKTVIKGGEVQRMSTGTGVSHSEHNHTEGELHLYQLWFIPNKKGLTPSYEQKPIDFTGEKNQLIPLVTGQKVLEDVVFINSNSTIYHANLSEGKEIDFKTFPIRKGLIYVTSGELFVNGIQVQKNDQVRSADVDALRIQATADSSFLLIDLPGVEANY